jgi:hypothetical protein
VVVDPPVDVPVVPLELPFPVLPELLFDEVAPPVPLLDEVTPELLLLEDVAPELLLLDELLLELFAPPPLDELEDPEELDELEPRIGPPSAAVPTPDEMSAQ